MDPHSQEYDKQIAFHYQAYRPPLHEKILSEVIENQGFEWGLDIGSGTGRSAVALKKYCKFVLGIEPSSAMLRKCHESQDIEYRLGGCEDIPENKIQFDIVTLAGSLYYCKSARSIAEVRRVCKIGSLVVIYDFEVRLEETLNRLSLKTSSKPSPYDHAVNLHGAEGFIEQTCWSRPYELKVTSAQIEHVILSNKERYSQVIDNFGNLKAFREGINSIFTEAKSALETQLYLAAYTLESK